ncbi:alpha/beta hydrolase [Bradyrhizobium diazoefficiens]|uniref:alpha/beta fold hydrolase n=1 Tax=Bradyrhizobium diazoefficiens TaxID=1355477 RepID=UPI00190BC6E4|nr:alpha/beta hydrolase [Bradyrhizobium diazoefficiens]QQO16758.1 alpha/beta hydrolase [Bradyrhizobium diazoefficiens]
MASVASWMASLAIALIPTVHAAAAPAGFISAVEAVNGAQIHYVRGGSGPPLLLIHGFPQNWSEYRPVLERLARRYTVIALDIRGIGESKGDGPYDARTLAEDVRQLVAKLNLKRPYVVGHDIGGQVTYALVRLDPSFARGAMLMDAPIPGIDGWDESLKLPGVWHVGFMQTPGLPEQLLAGREAVFIDYFMGFSRFTPAEQEASRAAYATPAQWRAALGIYRAFPENARWNAAQHGANPTPMVLGAGERSPFLHLLPKFAAGLRASGFAQVKTEAISGAAHYVIGEQPAFVTELIEREAGS